jgi:hypothetical protein
MRFTWKEIKNPPNRNLAIYGDSYADPNVDPGWLNPKDPTLEQYRIISWAEQLQLSYSPGLNVQDKVHIDGCYGRSGSSNWAAYTKFLANYSRYSRIVFVWTNFSRWPYLPAHMDGRNFDIYNSHLLTGRPIDSHTQLLAECNQVYSTVYSDSLLDFININIFRSVEQLCHDSGIKLVHVLSNSEFTRSDYGYPILHNLGSISLNEPSGIDGLNMRDLIHDQHLLDIRPCHLNTQHNQQLYLLVRELLDGDYQGLVRDLAQEEWSHAVDPKVRAFYLNYKQLVSTSK